jgi:hypothetical protein
VVFGEHDSVDELIQIAKGERRAYPWTAELLLR